MKTFCVCGNQEVIRYGKIVDGRELGFCLICGLLRTLEIPDNYSELYTQGVRYHEEREGHVAYKDRFSHDCSVATTRLGKHLNNISWLDVGCSNGGFLAVLRNMGIDCEGLEINPTMAQFAREMSKSPVHITWKSIIKKYDIISYHDVIEHCVDPVEELIKARQYLNDSGLLIVDTPSTDDPRFEELDDKWHHLKPKEHVFFFDQSSICDLFNRAGFVVDNLDVPIQGKIVAYGRVDYNES